MHDQWSQAVDLPDCDHHITHCLLEMTGLHNQSTIDAFTSEQAAMPVCDR